ncbi:MAG: Gfo/Idh/MocA family protein [Planctomycetota bacterium]
MASSSRNERVEPTGTSLPRRKFLQASAALAGCALAAPAVSYGRIMNRPAGPRVAVIGVNSRGKDHMNGFGEAVVALCDCDSQVLERRCAEVAKAEPKGRTLAKYKDFRKLLESPEIDCVSIATPNHTHSLLAIHALLAGKDVYVEKPVSHNVWEGRQLASAAAKLGRVCQCGTQSRSSSALKEAREYLYSGALGSIQYAIGTCYKPRMAIGKLSEPLKVPAEIDYDLWLGPAANLPIMRPKLHYDWHWDFNTGNGDMGNQGIHQMDIARWFLGEKVLSPKIRSIGARLGYDDAGNTPNTQIVLHQYPTAPLIFETRGLPKDKASQVDAETWAKNMDNFRGSRVGVLIQCERGYLVIPNYTSAKAFDPAGTVLKEWSGGGDHLHYRNFLDAVTSRDPAKLNAPVLEGHLSSALCHTGAISHLTGERASIDEIKQEIAGNDLFLDALERMLRHLAANEVDLQSQPVLTLGRELQMDPAAESILNHDQAATLLSRDYRRPFEIPRV